MANKYLEELNKAYQREYDLKEEQMQRQVIRNYQNAIANLAKQVTKAGTATHAMKNEYIVNLVNGLRKTVEEYGLDASTINLNYFARVQRLAMKEAGLEYTEDAERTVAQIIGNTSKMNLQLIKQGKMYEDGASLSDRIWNIARVSGGNMQDIVSQMVAQGMSANKMGKELIKYLNPSYAAKNGFKNQLYAGVRLARTTYTHMGQLATQNAAKVSPYVTKIKWRSDCSDRACSQCIERNNKVYEIGKCPFDHPNGRCWQEAVVDKSLDEIADELKAWSQGEPNERLDNWYKQMGRENPSLALRNKKPKPSDIQKVIKPSSIDYSTAEVNDLREYAKSLGLNMVTEVEDTKHNYTIDNMDIRVLRKVTEWTDNFTKQYPKMKDNELQFFMEHWRGSTDGAYVRGQLILGDKYCDSEDMNDYFDGNFQQKTRRGWSAPTGEGSIQTFVHEYGHYTSHILACLDASTKKTTYTTEDLPSGKYDSFVKKIRKETIDEYNKEYGENLKLKDMRTVVSEYSATNAHEFFAESFAELYNADEEQRSDFNRTFEKVLLRYLEGLK